MRLTGGTLRWRGRSLSLVAVALGEPGSEPGTGLDSQCRLVQRRRARHGARHAAWLSAAAVDRDRQVEQRSSSRRAAAPSRAPPGRAAAPPRGTPRAGSPPPARRSAPASAARAAAGRRSPAAQVPAVELAEEPDRALLAHLARDLAHEPDELGRPPRRVRRRAARRRPSRAAAHGRPCAPRPTITAAAPVSVEHRSAVSRSTMSPEAMTGTATRSTSSAVSVWSANPVYICWAERGCSVSAATPRSSSLGPRSSAAREPFFSPRRIFTVTGTSTASTTAPAIRQASS